MEKQKLIDEINNLKTDVQSIINSKSKEQSELTLKTTKIKMIKKLTQELQTICKKEKESRQMVKDQERVMRMADSRDFQVAKQNKSKAAMDKAKSAKEQREESRLIYESNLELEQKYYSKDPEEYPGFLFFHDRILKEYQYICPDVLFDVDETTKEDIEKRRSEWLVKQKDNGMLYRSLFNEIVKQDAINKLNDQKQQLITDQNGIITTILGESQSKIYEKCITFLSEYTECKVKSKKMRERYKIMINDFSILFSETGLEIHKYQGCLNTIDILINDIDSNKNHDIYIADVFNRNAEKLAVLVEEIRTKLKYYDNTIRNLKNELYMYLTKQKTLEALFEPVVKKEIKQAPKYFRRWIKLTNEEINERFESFSKWYIEKFLVYPGYICEESKIIKIEELTTMLTNAYEKKLMVYRDFSWITKKGIIEDVKILRYEKESNVFTLAFTKQQKKSKQERREEQERNIQLKQQRQANGETVTTSTKTKSSSRSIFTKDNEKHINEEVLKYVVQHLEDILVVKQNVQTLKDTVSKNKQDKQNKKNELSEIKTRLDNHYLACVDRIKLKLKVVKIIVKDREQVKKKFDEMVLAIISSKE